MESLQNMLADKLKEEIDIEKGERPDKIRIPVNPNKQLTMPLSSNRYSG